MSHIYILFMSKSLVKGQNKAIICLSGMLIPKQGITGLKQADLIE